jgi:hypothetical protein
VSISSVYLICDFSPVKGTTVVAESLVLSGLTLYLVCGPSGDLWQ